MNLAKRLTGSMLAVASFVVMCLLLARHGIGGSPHALTFLLATYGLTTLITESKIGWPFSQLAGKIPVIGPGLYHEKVDGEQEGLLTCSMCTGMWVGALLAGLGVSLYPVAGPWDLAVHGVISSGWSFAVHCAVEKLKR